MMSASNKTLTSPVRSKKRTIKCATENVNSKYNKPEPEPACKKIIRAVDRRRSHSCHTCHKRNSKVNQKNILNVVKQICANTNPYSTKSNTTLIENKLCNKSSTDSIIYISTMYPPSTVPSIIDLTKSSSEESLTTVPTTYSVLEKIESPEHQKVVVEKYPYINDTEENNAFSNEKNNAFNNDENNMNMDNVYENNMNVDNVHKNNMNVDNVDEENNKIVDNVHKNNMNVDNVDGSITLDNNACVNQTNYLIVDPCVTFNCSKDAHKLTNDDLNMINNILDNVENIQSFNNNLENQLIGNLEIDVNSLCEVYNVKPSDNFD